MNDVPLIRKTDINDINTSLIAIKKQLRQLNEAVGLIDVPDVDLTPFVRKDEVVNEVTSGNMNPVTSNAVATYINNQNVLSDFENSNASFTAQYDGFIYVWTVSGACTVRINNISITGDTSIRSGYAVPGGVTFPVKKGDNVEVIIGETSTSNIRARYYKLRDYSMR